MLIDEMKVIYLQGPSAVEAVLASRNMIFDREPLSSEDTDAQYWSNESIRVRMGSDSDPVPEDDTYAQDWSNESIRVRNGEKEIKTSPPLKGVHPKISPRRKRRVLHRRRLKEMEKEKQQVSQMFEEENKIMKHKYGIVKKGDIWEGRTTTWTDPYFTHNKMKELKNEKESDFEEGLPPMKSKPEII